MNLLFLSLTHPQEYFLPGTTPPTQGPHLVVTQVIYTILPVLHYNLSFSVSVIQQLASKRLHSMGTAYGTDSLWLFTTYP